MTKAEVPEGARPVWGSQAWLTRQTDSGRAREQAGEEGTGKTKEGLEQKVGLCSTSNTFLIFLLPFQRQKI